MRETVIYHVHILLGNSWHYQNVNANGIKQPATYWTRGDAVLAAREIKKAYPGKLVRIAKHKVKGLEVV